MTLSVAFLWHLHQPPYRDPLSGRWILPWVRLHALKDYYDMAAILGEVPEVALNFNFSPCLLSQLSAYASGQADEVLRDIVYKPTLLLSDEERGFLLSEGFQANPRTLIKPHPRYHELFLKRGRKLEGNIGETLARFSEQDLRDLQVWSQLAWVDPWYVSGDSDLSSLLAKEKEYTEEDKLLLQKKEQELLFRIIPTYRKLWEQGRIELTTSPYYHPILPLLADSDVSKECMLQAKLPQQFAHPEDALRHLEKAAKAMEQFFGKRPKGLWPSEGAVSAGILPLISQAGFEWLATDEDILRNSLPEGRSFKPDDLYSPWNVEVGEGRMTLLFRNKTLSDLIGFEYSRWPAEEAVGDFMDRLREIQRQEAEGKLENPLVLIALDGENAWEYYPRDGREFLLALYRALSREKDIRTVKISDYLNVQSQIPRKLFRLFPGSWINRDFSTWIGSEAHNHAWNLLRVAREAVVRAGGPEEAWESLYAAEGSDWFWWYSGRHSSTHLAEFDLLFRHYLIEAYKKAVLPPPAELYEPIVRPQEVRRGPDREPRGAIHPILDGKVTDYYEWKEAGRYDLRWGGAMPYPRGLLTELLYGKDKDNLYMGLFFSRLSPKEEERLTVTLEVIKPVPMRLTLLREMKAQPPCSGTLGKILEVAVPFKALGNSSGKTLSFFLDICLKGEEEERYPEKPVLILPFDEAQGETQWIA